MSKIGAEIVYVLPIRTVILEGVKLNKQTKTKALLKSRIDRKSMQVQTLMFLNFLVVVSVA